MNHTSLIRFGYCNAFIYFPSLFELIPFGKPYFFVSEGFFEDLSAQEQRFLIGHELAHIKERHTKYENLISLLLFILLVIGALGVRRYVNRKLQHYVSGRKYSIASYSIVCFLVCFCILVPELLWSAYRRHIEREADYQSLSQLNTYEGALKLIDRWEKEYKIPAINPYFGLFADHPACRERKQYCLYVQKLHEGVLDGIKKT